MERSIENVQKVQDAFAHQCQLSLIIVDKKGIPITTPSLRNRLSQLIYEKVLSDHEHNQIFQRLSNINKTSVVDMFPGLQVMISPISYAGEIQYYVCSGVFIEEGTRSHVSHYIASNIEEAQEWQTNLAEIEEKTSQQKQQDLEAITSFAQIISQLLQTNVQKEIWQHIISGLAQASEVAQMSRANNQLLETFKQLHKKLDFVGLALEREDGCIISQVIGETPFQSLIGSQFSVGEGYLGQTLAMGEMGYWENVEMDPRSFLFTKKDIQPKVIVCYPILQDQKVLGVLFAGSCTSSTIDHYLIDIGKVMANILSISLGQQELKEEWLIQQQRVSVVMEVCQLISRTRDKKKLAFMLVDMSLNITQAKFATVAIFQPNAAVDEMRMFSRGLTTEQTDQYGKILLNTYSGERDSGNSGERNSGNSGERISGNNGDGTRLADSFPPTGEPVKRELDWGATVMEFPIVNGKLYGVLSICAEEGLVEQKAFISSLTTIGGLALHLAHQAENETKKLVHQLLQAAKYWDEKQYLFAVELKEWVMKFTDFLQLPMGESEEIENACLLSIYSPGYIKQNISEAEGLYQIIKDYDQLFHRKEEKHNREQESIPSKVQEAPAQTNYSLAGQAMAIVAIHLTAKGKRTKEMIGVDEELQEKFTSFLLSIEVHDQQIKKEEEIKLELDQLSKREQEVAHLLMQGMHNKEIAYELFISEHTVKNHITNIYNKLGVSDRPSLMAYFYHRKK